MGAVDYGLDTEVNAAWETNGVYASLGRRFRGDSDRFDRRDGWVVSAGGWQRLNEKLDAGAFYDWSQSSISGLDAFQDLGAYLSYRLTPEFRLQGIASAGMRGRKPSAGMPTSSAAAARIWRCTGPPTLLKTTPAIRTPGR